VLSELEVVHEERQGHLWHIKYPVAGTKEFLVVATTRPETMLGDTAVAVNPKDERYAHLVGKKALLPLMNREIPIIADEMVDREFGTGAVKITPAHDPNDFEVGRRHKLAEIDVMTDDGKMNAAAGAYAGIDRFEARKKIVEDLKALGLLEKITEHTNAIGLCERSNTIVEPRASTQWFCTMKPLAEPAIAVVERGEIQIVPENRRQEYLNRMVLQGEQAHHSRTGNSGEVRDLQVGESRAGSRRFGYVVQLGALAVLDFGLAGKHSGLQDLLPDDLTDHGIRHPVFLGGADDHAGNSLYGENCVPRRVSALAGAYRKRRENVQNQRDGARPGSAEPAVRDGCDAFLSGVDGRAGNRHRAV